MGSPENMICEKYFFFNLFWGGGSQKILTVILTCNFSFLYCDHRGLLCVKLQQQKSLINACIKKCDLNLTHFNKDNYRPT